MRTTSVALGAYFDNYVKTSVERGRFNNASEMIRAALRLLEEQEAVMALRTSLQEGLESEIIDNFDPEEHLKLLKSRKNA